MRIYLDTSTIRKRANDFNAFNYEDFFTSSLTVFELISGIKERDFLLRKKVIINLINSSIYIDWETYKKKMYNAFNQKYNDIEGYVIKRMAQLLVDCNTFEEYKNIRIYVNDDSYYTYESFEYFDNEITKTGKLFSIIGQREWQNLDKTIRKSFIKEFIDEKKILPYVQILFGLSLISLAEDIAGCQRPDDEYIRVIKNNDSGLDIFLRYNQLLFFLCELNGSKCGKNDMFDTMHLIYLKENDVLISEDKIFKKLNDYVQMLKVCTYDEFDYGTKGI